MVFGRAPRATDTSANGRTIRPMAMGYISGSTVTSMKGSSKSFSNMDRVSRSSQTETHTKESIKVVSQMVMVNIHGIMGVFSREPSSPAFVMVRVYG